MYRIFTSSGKFSDCLVACMLVLVLMTNPVETTLAAEKDWCGTEEYYQQRAAKSGRVVITCPSTEICDWPNIRDNNIPDSVDFPLLIRLTINYYSDDDGQHLTTTPAQIAAQVQTLNQVYGPYKIQFTYAIQYIGDSRFRHLMTDDIDSIRYYYTAAGLTVHVVNVDPSVGFSGQAVFPWDFEALTHGGVIIDAGAFGGGQHVLVHEIGHALGLWHTHHGIEYPDPDFPYVCNDCWERADGLHSDSTGDFCSDTPATSRNLSCSELQGADSCFGGTPWAPTDFTNFMGYGGQNCWDHFTPQQVGRMHCWISHALQEWTREGCYRIASSTCPEFREVFIESTEGTCIRRTGNGNIVVTSTNGYIYEMDDCGKNARRNERSWSTQSILEITQNTDNSIVGVADGTFGILTTEWDSCRYVSDYDVWGDQLTRLGVSSVDLRADNKILVAGGYSGIPRGSDTKGYYLAEINNTGDTAFLMIEPVPLGEGKGIQNVIELPNADLMRVFSHPTCKANPPCDTAHLKVERLTPTGQPIWDTAITDSCNRHVRGVAGVFGDGSLVAACMAYFDSYNYHPLFAICLNNSGQELWRRYFSGTEDFEIESAITDTDGDLLVLGTAWLHSSLRYAPMLIKIRQDGAQLWTRVFEDSTSATGKSIVIDSDGNYLFTGKVGDLLYVRKVHREPEYLCGDADGNGVITVSDAVYMITYIFGGGPEPNPLIAGDADCNGITTISDAVYMITWVFGGGPAPCAGCQ